MKSIRFAVAAAAALMCGSAVAANFAAKKEISNDVWIQSDKSGYSVEYVGKGDVSGLQFDIYDKAIVDGNYSCGEALASSHIASCTLNEKEGFLRVLVFSLTNASLADTTLVRVSTGASSFSQSKSSAALKNVIFSDSKGQNVTPEHL
jgi:hypothetical protein